MELLQTKGMSKMPASLTVQTVLFHPSAKRVIYWVLNKEEPSSLDKHQVTSKPRGWGNPGGSAESIDYLDRNGAPNSFEETITLCGAREVTDETGFLNFTFRYVSQSQPIFLRNDDPYGHCVVTLAARLKNVESQPVKEDNEIICGSWFDLTLSPVSYFRGSRDLPYWSHVRRTLEMFQYLATQTRDKNDKNFINTIHPLWNLVFPFKIVDNRFPKDTYMIPREDWYRVMRACIKNNIHTVDLDLIYEEVIKGKKHPMMHIPRSDVKQTKSYLSPKERIDQYEEEYRLWAEQK